MHRFALVVALGVLAGCSGHARTAATAPTSTTSSTTDPTTTTAALSTSTTSPGRPTLPAGATYAVNPTSPAAAAADIIDASAILEDPASNSAAVATIAPTLVAAYRTTAANPGWKATVIAALPPARRAAADANITAATELRLLTAPRTALPPWRIVEPPPATELLADYKAAESATGIPWAYLAAVHFVETRMGRIRGPSTAGARGPMQFLPSTWARYGNGGDIENTHDAIAAAGRLLAADGGPADMGKALFAYNHSQHYVRAVTLYAQRMQTDEREFRSYRAWPVVYRMVAGDVVLDTRYVGA